MVCLAVSTALVYSEVVMIKLNVTGQSTYLSGSTGSG
jgi:hypothetical protein